MSSPEQLNQELSTLKSKFQQALTIIKTLQSDNEILRTEITSKTSHGTGATVDEEEFDELEKDNTRLKNENAVLAQNNQQLTLKLEHLVQKGQTLASKAKEQQEFLAKKEEELVQLRELVLRWEQSPDSPIHTVHNGASGGIDTENGDKVKRSHDQTNDLSNDNSQLKAQLTDTQAKLQDTLGKLNDTLSSNEELTTSLERATNTIVQYEMEQNHSKQTIDDLQQDASRDQERISQLSSDLTSSEQQRIKDHSAMVDLQRQNVENQATIAHHEAQIFEFESKLDSIYSSNTATETVATELQQILSQNSALQKRMDILTRFQEKSDLDHQEELTLLAQVHQNEITEHVTQFEFQLSQAHQGFEQLQNKYQQDIVQNHQQLQQKDKEITQLTTKLDEHRQTISNLEQRIIQLDDNLHNIIVGHEQQLQSLTLDQTDNTAQLLSQIAVLQHGNSTLQLQLDKLELHTKDNASGTQSDIDGDMSSSSAHTDKNSSHHPSTYQSPFHPATNKSHKSSSYVSELSKAAEHQRQLDLRERQHIVDIEKLKSIHHGEKQSIFTYINQLRIQLIQTDNYITWLTTQLQACLLNQKRNGVDIDYVKNILLRFLLFQKLGLDSQRDAMIPVIAQLLHFSTGDLKMLQTAGEKAKEFANSGWTGNWFGANGKNVRSFSEDLDMDYDPMSSIQSQSAPVSQQSSVIANKEQFEREQLDKRREAAVEDNNSQSNSPKKYLKPGRNLASNGLLNSIKDLDPPVVDILVPSDIIKFGYSDGSA